MPSGDVLVDTSALLAILNRSDALHDSAVRVHQQLIRDRTRLVLSDWILAEFLNAASKKPIRAAAIRIVERIRASPRTTVIPADRAEWQRAFAYFAQHKDKSWSFVDCSSMLICRDRDVRVVFSHDRHFEQAGLEVLLRG